MHDDTPLAASGHTPTQFEPAPWQDKSWARARALLLACLNARQQNPRVPQMLAAWADSDMPTLVRCAQFHGMAQLLALHAGAGAPKALRRALMPLSARARHAAGARQAMLAALGDACASCGIQVVLLKGAALGAVAYPDPGLRPMRDVDILVAPAHMPLLLDVMAKMGFVATDAQTPPGHHHLPAQRVMWEHAPIYVEPHTALGVHHISTPVLLAAARPHAAFDGSLWVPSLEHLLWHVWRHGFVMPFSAEATKLIWLADLHALGEQWGGRPEFAEALRARPSLRQVLAALHAAVPWSAQVQQALAPAPLGAFSELHDYAGWPRQPSLRATLRPPNFWLAMRHGARVGPVARTLMHVRHWRDVAQRFVQTRYNKRMRVAR